MSQSDDEGWVTVNSPPSAKDDDAGWVTVNKPPQRAQAQQLERTFTPITDTLDPTQVIPAMGRDIYAGGGNVYEGVRKALGGDASGIAYNTPREGSTGVIPGLMQIAGAAGELPGLKQLGEGINEYVGKPVQQATDPGPGFRNMLKWMGQDPERIPFSHGIPTDLTDLLATSLGGAALEHVMPKGRASASGKPAPSPAQPSPAAPVVGQVSTTPAPKLSVAEAEMVRRLAQSQRAGGPTAQDALDHAAQIPHKPLTILDAVRRPTDAVPTANAPVQALAGRTFRTGGTAKQKMVNFFTSRNALQGRRLRSDIDSMSPLASDPVIEALKKARHEASSPLYLDAYFHNPVIVSPVIDSILDTPIGKEALKKAVVRMQDDMSAVGEADPKIAAMLKSEGFKVPADGIARGLNLRTLDYVKRAMDHKIGSELASAEPDMDGVRVWTARKNELIDELNRLDVSPDKSYRKALEAYAGPSSATDAIKFGQKALEARNTPESNTRLFNALSPSEKEFARMGLAQAIRDKLSKIDIGGRTNRARALALSEDWHDRMQPFFRSDADFNRFLDSALAEDTMFQAGTDITKGSQTVERLTEDQSDPRLAMAGHMAATVGHAAGGNPFGVGKGIYNTMKEWAERPRPEVANELADLLTANLNDPVTQARFKILHGLADQEAQAAAGSLFLNRMAPNIGPNTVATVSKGNMLRNIRRGVGKVYNPTTVVAAGPGGTYHSPDYVARATRPGGE